VHGTSKFCQPILHSVMTDVVAPSSTRGLDASTALEFVRALRIATDVARLSTIVSIYQASESLYQLFDKVCVIYEGKMAYYGPANQARQYFIDMGYEPANRQTTADFLVAVTDPLGRIERPYVTSIPRTASEFVAHFQKSVIGQANRDDMEAYRSEFVGKPMVSLKQCCVWAKTKHGRRERVCILKVYALSTRSTRDCRARIQYQFRCKSGR
jgi:ATP-binding cassette subfamily G (WHITE) protein 2 (SNQ2)